MKQKNQISARHCGLMILSGEIGLGIISYPADLAQKVGHDGWISILMTGALALVLTLIVMLLLRRYRNRSIYEINRCLFGNWLGQVFNGLLLVYLVMVAGYFLRVFSEYIRLFHLVRIPLPVITLLIIAPTLFLTWKGYRAIGRFSYFMLVVLGAIVLLAVKVFGDLRFSFLQPVAAAGWPRMAGAVPEMFMAFIGLELAVFIYAEVRDRERVLFWGMSATSLTLFLLALVSFCTTGVFGEKLLQRLVAPLFSLSQYAQFPLIERLDLVFFILWFPVLESTFRVYFATAYTGIRKLGHLDNNPLYYGIFTGIVFGLSLIPADLNQTVAIGKGIAVFGSAVILYLAGCWGLSFVRRRGVVKG